MSHAYEVPYSSGQGPGSRPNVGQYVYIDPTQAALELGGYQQACTVLAITGTQQSGTMTVQCVYAAPLDSGDYNGRPMSAAGSWQATSGTITHVGSSTTTTTTTLPPTTTTTLPPTTTTTIPATTTTVPATTTTVPPATTTTVVGSPPVWGSYTPLSGDPGVALYAGVVLALLVVIALATVRRAAR